MCSVGLSRCEIGQGGTNYCLYLRGFALNSIHLFSFVTYCTGIVYVFVYVYVWDNNVCVNNKLTFVIYRVFCRVNERVYYVVILNHNGSTSFAILSYIFLDPSTRYQIYATYGRVAITEN